MSSRPANLDLSGSARVPADTTSPRGRFNMDLPSPRAGEIPPALSPLDMFAQQSRLLAKKFQESQQQGRRMSRLDHLEVASEFANRPTYFRSASTNSQAARIRADDESERQVPPMPITQNIYGSLTPGGERPVSHYPLFGVSAGPPAQSRDPFRVTHAPVQQQPDNYFGIQVPRAQSPEAYETRAGPPSPKVPSLSGSIDSLHSSQARTNTDDSYRPMRRGLAPQASPTPPVSKKGPLTLRSVMNIEDDELLPPRKFSDNAYPRARSPYTPDPSHPTDSRSPSIRSDHSMYQEDFRRPSFNFSRPLSSASNKDFSMHRRQPSHPQTYEPKHSSELARDRGALSPNPSFQFSSHSVTPERGRAGFQPETASLSEDDSSIDHTPLGAPSYIDRKYSLPRGRTIERFQVDSDDAAQHHYQFEEAPDHRDRDMGLTTDRFANLALDQPRPLQPPQLQSSRSFSADGRGLPQPRMSAHRSTPSSPSVYSTSTDRTIRGHARNSPSQDIASMTAEQHLEKGIECHSSGSLSKSTYHLRHAARLGSPTGMLLYALACRHGWGMRANPNEGVSWLKKAVDSSSLEMLADDPSLRGDDLAAAKARKAQFALAIYELGMSYMNGWGTGKDKSLAVRCFEVAGSWGDVDALAEAAFCYTQGVGVKKDLKKAAGLYRQAADRGMSMAGNSWIYKDKYMDQPAPSPTPAGDKPRQNRSRAKSIFGRKKATKE